MEILSKYSSIIRLIVIDSIWRFKREVFLIFTTGFLGFIFQIGTMAVSFYYARVMGEGKVFRFFKYDFNARSSVVLLILCGLTVLFSLLLSAWLIYLSKTRSLMLRLSYEEFCSKRIFTLLGSSLRIWIPNAIHLRNDRFISRLARNDAQCCGRVLWMFIDIIIPTVVFLVSFGVLLYINIFLTILNIFLVIISAIFLYRVNIRVVRNSSMVEKYAEEVREKYRQVINWQKAHNFSISKDSIWLKNNFFSSDTIKKYMDAYLGKLVAIENSQLISNILLGIAIFSIIVILGSIVILGGQGWDKLIIYLLALRYMLVNSRQVNNKIININRYYPQIRRYFQFIENTVVTKQIISNVQTSYSLVVCAYPLRDSLKSYDLQRGSKVSLISPIGLNRYTLAFLIDCLFGCSPNAKWHVLGSVWFATLKYGYAGCSLRELFGFPPEYTWNDLCEEMKEAGMSQKLEVQLSHDLDKPISHNMWNNVEPDLKYALALLNAVHSNCQWVILQEKGMRTFTESTCKFFLERLYDRIIIVVFYKGLDFVGKYCEDVVAVISDSKLVGLGPIDWYVENKQEIEIIGNARIKKREKNDIDTEIEFEDIEI